MKKYFTILLTILACVSNAQTINFDTLEKLINTPEDSVKYCPVMRQWKKTFGAEKQVMYVYDDESNHECLNFDYEYAFLIYTISDKDFERFEKTLPNGNLIGNYYMENIEYRIYAYKDKKFTLSFNISPDNGCRYIRLKKYYTFERCMEIINVSYKNNYVFPTDLIASLLFLKSQYENELILDEKKYYEVCNALFYNYRLRGDNYSAYIIMRQTLDTFNKKCPKKNTELIRRTHTSIMSVLQAIKNYETAILIGKQVKNMFEEVSDYGFDYMAVMQNLAICYALLGDINNAVTANDKTVEICEKIYGSIFNIQESGQYLLLSNFGMCYYATGDINNAQKCYEYVVKNSKQDYYENDAFQLACSGLAQIYMRNKRYKECIDLFKKIKTYDRDIEANCYSGFVICYLGLKEYEKAVENLKFFNNVALSEVVRIFSNYPESEREGYWENTITNTIFLNNIVAYYTNNPTAIKTAYENYVFYRMLLMEHPQIIKQCVNKSNNMELKNLYSDYKKSKNNCFFSGNNDSYVEAQNIEEAIIHKIKNLDTVLRDNFINYETIKDKLSEDECIIDFTSVKKIIQYGKSEDFYAAYITRKDFITPKLVILGKRESIDSMFFYSGDDKLIINETYLEQNLKRMYNAVFLPLLSSLYGVKKIYYIPCGGLTQLNFDLLKNNNGIELGKLYVMSRQTFPHKLVKNQPIYKKNIKNVVIFGGITYDSSYVSHTQKPTLTPMFRNTDFNDLDNTKYEIEQIASIFNNKKIQNHIFSGANATEDSFKKNSIQPIDIIHIATHGFCLDTDADLTKNKKYTNQTNPRTNREAAMLFSGLAFAGANKTWKGTFDGQGYENGILTAYEISQLDLSKVKFVVLSACETAKGWIYDFDGVFGLQRAFKQAGAGSILMSLWKVDDQATALFMEHFYKFLLQSGDRHEALKLAQDEVKKQYPDPYYWAAWVMLD